MELAQVTSMGGNRVDATWNDPAPDGADLSVSGVVALCGRHRVLIGMWIVAVLALTTAVVLQLQPRYRAEAMLMLDTRVEHLSDLKSVVSTPFTTQDAAPIMRSEVQILMSPELAGKVVDKLDLAHVPSFLPQVSWFEQSLTDAVGYLGALCARVISPDCAAPPQPPVDAARQRIALIDGYLKRLGVFNDGKSYTLAVSFEDPDPKLAALIANTHADFYLADQRAFKRRASTRGLSWIDQQIDRLRSELDAKEQSLAKFRETSGLVSAQGSTLVAQQVTQIGTLLAQARADLAQREARLAGARGATRRGNTSVQSDVLNSALIQRMREQEATSQQELADATQRYGSNHPAVLQMRARADEIGRRIASETQRIVIANDGDTTVAQRRVSEIEATLEDLRKQLVAQERATSRFTEMERDAAALRLVYQGLLARQQELDAQAGTEDADARLVSPGIEPLLPYFPNKSMLLAIASLLAGVSGVGLAFLVDKPGRGIETPAHLDATAGMLSLHPLPLVTKSRYAGRSLADHPLDSPNGEFAEAIRSLRDDITALPLVAKNGRGRHAAHDDVAAEPLVATVDRPRRSLPDYLLGAPKAEFADAIRSLGGEVAGLGRARSFPVKSIQTKTVQVLAITSALPREGKTTVAVALGRSLAASGLKVLLIDCDLRRPRVHDMVGARTGEFGIVSVLEGRSSLKEATIRDPRSHLSVLPVEQQVGSPQDLLGSAAFRDLLAQARAIYDFVVLDTPPQGAVSDPLIIAEEADATILLVRWKSTPVSIVAAALRAFQKRGVPLDGIFLNGVDQRSMTRNDVDLRTAYQSTRSYYLAP